MCGVFGVLQHEGGLEAPVGRLQETARRLSHRGPDGHGYYCDSHIALVHTRLALLDLTSRSDQPFADASGRWRLVYNGEIYNYRELRDELAAEDVSFRTDGDTEVLLHALVRWGVPEALQRLEGMFAFGLYDRDAHRLTLARDRLGIKPLYIADRGDRFLFTSDLRALHPWMELRPDLLSLSSYLQGFGGPTRGACFFEGVQIMAPGTWSEISLGGRPRVNRYFSVGGLWNPHRASNLAALSPKQQVDAVDQALTTAVRRRMVADAPLGALCSGGIDSSLVLALAAKLGRRLTAFHADVVGAYSECESAQLLARRLGVELHVVPVCDDDFIEDFPDVALHYGYPFSYHRSCVPFLAVSRLVHRHGVKAVLSGEGSDECFLGYTHLVPNLRRLALQAPERIWSHARLSLRRLRKRFRENIALSTLPGEKDRQLVASLHNRLERETEAADILESWPVDAGKGGAPSAGSRKTFLELTYHLRTLLHRNDALGMAASIEARFPFLDTGVLDLAANLPYRCKVRFSPWTWEREHPLLRDKWIVRRVAERYLPPALCHRKKWGFPNDAYRRMRVAPEFFRGSIVSELFSLNQRQTERLILQAGHPLKLRLLHLEVWCHMCWRESPREDLQRKLRSCLKFADARAAA